MQCIMSIFTASRPLHDVQIFVKQKLHVDVSLSLVQVWSLASRSSSAAVKIRVGLGA